MGTVMYYNQSNGATIKILVLDAVYRGLKTRFGTYGTDSDLKNYTTGEGILDSTTTTAITTPEGAKSTTDD